MRSRYVCRLLSCIQHQMAGMLVVAVEGILMYLPST